MTELGEQISQETANKIAAVLKEASTKVLELIKDKNGETVPHACIVAMVTFALVGWRFGRRVGLSIPSCVRLIRQTMEKAERSEPGTVEELVAGPAMKSVDRKTN